MHKAILFDLGNTLIKYYERHEFEAILQQGIENVKSYLHCELGLKIPAEEKVWENVKSENHESPDYSVRLLEERLRKIFTVTTSALNSNEELEMCRRFMMPIFSCSSLYHDTLPVLRNFKEKGWTIIIVSNTAWGSPAVLWMEELSRYQIDKYIDGAVFCRDIGWRKPAKQIFEFVLEKYGLNADECLFVGDDPRWDIAGPEAVGMKTILINRLGNMNGNGHTALTDLLQLVTLLNQ